MNTHDRRIFNEYIRDCEQKAVDAPSWAVWATYKDRVTATRELMRRLRKRKPGAVK